MVLLPGTRHGSYEVLSLIGAGARAKCIAARQVDERHGVPRTQRDSQVREQRRLEAGILTPIVQRSTHVLLAGVYWSTRILPVVPRMRTAY